VALLSSTGLDDYPLPSPLSGGAPIHATTIKTLTICYEILPLCNNTAA
jgi:hypothetical protein